MPRRNRRSFLSVNIKALGFKLCLLVGGFFLLFFGWRLIRSGNNIRVNPDTVAAFNIPHRAIGLLMEYSRRHGFDFPELFTVFNLENDFFPVASASYDLSELERLYVADFERLMRRYNSRSLAPYVELYRNLFNDIEVFPVPSEWTDSVMFGNSWGIEHNFQGNRMHMGTAVIDRENISGRVPVVSMSSGIVTSAVFCNQLGYHVVITTANGTYFLYAHLDSIASNIFPGGHILAGEPVGQMGNTGGGSGRRSRSFQVHLHLAISPDTNITRGQFWINPYPLLMFLEAR